MSVSALSQISIQPVFRQRPEMKSSLIPDLVKNRRITPDIILQYCRSAACCTVSCSSICFNVEYEISFLVQTVFKCPPQAFLPVLKIILPFICSTFGLDCDRVINQYVTTLLLVQEDEEGAGDPGTGQEAMQPLCHTDVLERVLQILPMLHSTSELSESLSAAIFKVCASGQAGQV